MLSVILHDHLKRLASLYKRINPGQNLSPIKERSEAEAKLLEEIAKARQALRGHVNELGRTRPIRIATGEPKGAWAHIYYISFHDPANSHGPTEGFYPCFLMAVDQNLCWVSVCLSAASVGISGRGGWSKKRGEQLKHRAEFMGRNLRGLDGWKKGPIALGPDRSSLHLEHGGSRPAGRAYECGAIISKSFDPHDPPQNLSNWINSTFDFYDEIFRGESVYIETSIPHMSPTEEREQGSAAITGSAAEDFFIGWVPTAHPEWGQPIDRTHRVGLGFDIEFPDVGLKVEVKGCRGSIENIRITEREWEKARTFAEKYILAIVSHLDSPERTKVNFIQNPYHHLNDSASRQTRLQVTYLIPHRNLREHLIENLE